MLLHLQHFSRRQEEISRDCLQVACSVTGPSVIISEVHELVRTFPLHVTLSHTILCYVSLMAISYSTETPKFVCTYSVAVEFWLLPYKSAAWLMANLKSQAVIIWIFPTMAKYIATDKSQMPHRLIGSYKNGEKQRTEEIRGHTRIG